MFNFRSKFNAIPTLVVAVNVFIVTTEADESACVLQVIYGQPSCTLALARPGFKSSIVAKF